MKKLLQKNSNRKRITIENFMIQIFTIEKNYYRKINKEKSHYRKKITIEKFYYRKIYYRQSLL